MAEQQLQSRLDAVFGSLSRPGEEPSWQPSAKLVFRTGAPITDHDASSDEEAEYKERTRREVVPGLAMDLAAEDEADEEGFKPSTAFCRALDREDEYNEVDEIATGTYRGRALESLPPRSTEVLDDNVWEQQIGLREGRQYDDDSRGSPHDGAGTSSHQRAHPAAGSGRQGQQQDVPAARHPEGRGPGSNAGQGSSAPDGGDGGAAHDAEPGTSAEATQSKPSVQNRVRFQGLPQPWVPPHRRDGYIPRAPQNSLPPADAAAGPSANRKPGPRGIAQARVPHHVQHPDKYTMYTLDEPLVVGGGMGQLGTERHAQLEQAANWAKQPQREGVTEDAGDEPARWQGEVGGGIQFRPKAGRTASAPETADVEMAGSTPGHRSSTGARGTHPGPTAGRGVQLAYVSGEGEDAGGEAAVQIDCSDGGGVAAMEEVDEQSGQREGAASGHFKAVKGGRRVRGYRSKAAASDMGQGGE